MSNVSLIKVNLQLFGCFMVERSRETLDAIFDVILCVLGPERGRAVKTEKYLGIGVNCFCHCRINETQFSDALDVATFN